MNKCVKITVFQSLSEDFLKNIVQKFAQKYSLEGFGQQVDSENLKIIICGEKDNVDKFIDQIHKELIELDIKDFEIEAFLKDKEYRGVFRIIQ